MRILSLLALVFTFHVQSASAQQENSVDLLAIQESMTHQLALDYQDALFLGIEWKVGETQKFNMTLSGIGAKGTMVKTVAKDEGETLWLTQQMVIMGQNQKAEIQMSKADGKILQVIVNGKKQNVPEQDFEIISANPEDLTVPAGTFHTMHIKIKDRKSGKEGEVWMSPGETVMEGTIKAIQDAGIGGILVTLELTEFKRVQ